MALTPVLQVAYDILLTNKKAMHINEIADEAVKANKNMGLNNVDLASKLSTSLSQNLNTKTPAFAKVANKSGGFKRGIYRLKNPSVKAPPQPTPSFAELSTLYTGKAGEYAVMSELLFWGFNVSLMAVDEGIDIIAARDNKYFHIQVKASTEKVDSTNYNFTIKKDVFEANNISSTFYVLVLRATKKTDFIVLPSNQIDRHIKLGHVTGALNYSLRISYNEKSKRFYLNKDQDMTPHHNAFGQIR